MESWMYDLIIVAVILLVVWRRSRQGVVSALIRLLGWAAAVTLILGFAQEWAEKLYFLFLETRAVGAVTKVIPPELITSLQSGADALQQLQAALNSLSGFFGGHTVTFDQFNAIMAYVPQDVNTLAWAITRTVLQPALVGAVKTVISLLILAFCLTVFRGLADLLRADRKKRGALNKTNRVLGGVLGFAEGLAVVYVLVMVLSAAATSFHISWLTPDLLQNTAILSLFL